MAFHTLWVEAQALMWSWQETKLFVEHSSAFSSDSLHVIAGVLVLLVAALLLRTSVSSWRPWLVVLALVLTNEFADLWLQQWPHPGMQYGESAKDLLLTMFLPTILLLAARRAPRLWTRSLPPTGG